MTQSRSAFICTLNSVVNFTSLILLLLSFCIANSSWAQDFEKNATPFEEEEVEFLKVEEAYQVTPAITADQITLNWNIQPGYYLYQHQFKLTATNETGSETLDLQFEPGKLKYDDYFEKELTVYYDSTAVIATPPSLTAPYELKVTSQGCADRGLCYPPRHQYFTVKPDLSTTEVATSQFNSSGSSQNLASSSAPPAQNEETFLPLVLLGALFGGLILNLMPCVFPVLSLKALSFASSHLSKHSQHLHGWAYTGGVVISFLLAAIAILAARSAGEMLGWGFQLQQPGFVVAMIFLFFLMGLSLSGVFHFGTRLMGAGQSLTSGHGLGASFFTGVLAALVASPCTAPFMATALGFALTQPLFIALSVFVTLGFGMALPFLLLSYSPALAKHLPQPGLWMETLKQILAFPLYLTCIWLLWVLGNQVGSDGAMKILVALLCLTFAIWLFQQPTQKSVWTWTKRAFAFAGLIATGYTVMHTQPANSSQWEPYSPARLAELRNQGTAVFVDLTADWCVTCKINESVALNRDDVIKFAVLNDIVMLQGDWTNEDPQISALLEKFGRSGVPLYLMYPQVPNTPPEVLPQLLTESMVIKAMEQALR